MLDKILLIDDDEVTLILCKIIIEMNGFAREIVQAQNGQEGIDFYAEFLKRKQAGASEKPPALIFLDLNMPVMNGWDFLDDFYANYQGLLPATKVVILSSSIDPEDCNRAAKYDIVIDFISKPLDNEAILKLKNNKALQFS